MTKREPEGAIVPVPVGAAHAAVLAEMHAAWVRSPGEAPWSVESVVRLLRLPGAFALLALPAETPGDGAAVGFALCIPGGDGLDLAAIGVAPHRRRRGAGRTLLAAAVARARTAGASSVVLEVAADNVAALGLYASLGFVPIGRRHDYYRHAGGNADAIVMGLQFSGPAPG